MRTVSVREARRRFSELLDAVAAGEEIIIERRGRPTARLVSVVSADHATFGSRAVLRESLPMARTPSADIVREERDDVPRRS